MITRIRWTFVLCALALLFPASVAAQHFPSNEDLTTLIRSRVEDGGAVGIVLGVLEADGTTRIVSYGNGGEDARELGPKSVFELGSITKAFTGILLADMVARGEVSLSDPVAKYLPDGVTVPSRDGKEITLLDIATHRSSLTRMPTNMFPDPSGAYPEYTIEQLYEFLSKHELRRDIGSEFEYSNIAVALLGHALERVGGGSYEEVLQERILEPLGMQMTSTRVEGELRNWMTVGHDALGLVAPYRNWPNLPGMGALRSNVEDLLVFLAANTGPPESRLERVLRNAQEVRNTVNDDADIGLNWLVRKVGESRIITHGGATRGFRAFVGFDPDTRVGAVVLANSSHGIGDIGYHLINPEFPLTSAPVVDREEIEVAQDILTSYVGEYELRPSFVMNVTHEDGDLFVQATGQGKVPVFAESETKFFAREVNAQFSFTVDELGTVTALTLHQNGRNQPALRRKTPGVPLASTDDAEPDLPGERKTIASAVLGSERALRTVTPAGYNLSMSTRYPVLYVIEGDRPLHYAAGVTRSLYDGEKMPGMIVVHVGSVPSGDGRNDFLNFLTDELRPWVADQYRTAPFNVLASDSDAALFATQVLMQDPDAFQAYVSVDPGSSVQVTFREEWKSPNESADPHSGLREGLEWLFDGWELANIAALAAQPGGEGWVEINAHYAELSDRFGYEVVPHEDVADIAYRAFMRQGRFDDAIRELERNRELNPGSARVWNHLGDLYRLLCRREESKENYSKAFELAREMSYSNVSNYEMELGRITSEIESGGECTSPADRTDVEVAQEVLETYVGKYELSSSFSITVTLEDGALFAQPTGQGKFSLFAESETKFFMKAVEVQITFTKDDSGAVTGIILHQSGRNAPGRRVNN